MTVTEFRFRLLIDTHGTRRKPEFNEFVLSCINEIGQNIKFQNFSRSFGKREKINKLIPYFRRVARGDAWNKTSTFKIVKERVNSFTKLYLQFYF